MLTAPPPISSSYKPPTQGDLSMPAITCEQAKREFKTLSQIEERLSKKDIFMYLHNGHVRFLYNKKILSQAELNQFPDVKLLKTICPAVLHDFLRVHKLLKNPDGQYVPEPNFFIDQCRIPDYRQCFEKVDDSSDRFVIEDYFEAMENDGNLATMTLTTMALATP
jgi:hypothetical protein